MKYNIINIWMALIISGCAASKSGPTDGSLTNKEPAYIPTMANSQTIVFSRQGKMEALLPGKKGVVVLRETFSDGHRYSPDWQMSKRGDKLTFCATPDDEDFFDAGAVRDYLFLVAPNGKAKVLLAGYGPKSVSEDCYNYASSSFDQDGKKILMEEGVVGQFMDDPTYSWIAIYDIKTRKRLFQSEEFMEKMPVSASRKSFLSQCLSHPSLSPDGNDIVCIKALCPYGSVEQSFSPDQEAPAFPIIHFDLKRQRAEILASVDDQLAFSRTTQTMTTSIIGLPERRFEPQFAWHPTQKRFVFSGPAAPKTPGRNLFSYDLVTKKLTRLTSGTQEDFCPQWSTDGKLLYWLRGSGENAQIYCSDSDGQHVKRVMPNLGGIDRIQIVERLGQWSRYRKIPVEALAGKDK